MKSGDRIDMKVKIGKQYMAVPVGGRTRDFAGVITLNETGAFLWEKLQTEQTTEALVGFLMEEYDIDAKHGEESVLAFYNMLKKNNLVDGNE